MRKDRGMGYFLLVLGVLILALAGYSGYLLYPRFNLPPVVGISLLVLAAAAGIASFFSPSSFPLLIALLGRATGNGTPVSRALVFAAALSLGVTAFLMLVGALIAAGAAPFFAEITFDSTAGRALRGVVGLFLITLGLIQLGVIPVSLSRVANLSDPLMDVQVRLRRDRPGLAFGLFGFGYVLAGFG